MIKRLLWILAMAYGVYCVVMVAAHARYLYPFQQDRFDLAGFAEQSVAVGGADPLPAYVHQGRVGAPVVMYFMGNLGAVQVYREMLQHHAAEGRSVVAMAYRGGGGVPGEPSEAVLKRDALAVFDALEGLGLDGPVVVQGYSLGTGVAGHVAARRPVAGLVLSAPYDRLCDVMTRAAYLPACYLPVDKWRTARDVSAITAPVLVLHGTADALIPFSQGKSLAARFEDRPDTDTTMVALPGVGHTGLIEAPGYLDAIDEFMGSL